MKPVHVNSWPYGRFQSRGDIEYWFQSLQFTDSIIWVAFPAGNYWRVFPVNMQSDFLCIRYGEYRRLQIELYDSRSRKSVWRVLYVYDRRIPVTAKAVSDV